MARLKVDSLGVTDAGVPGLLDGGEGTEKKKKDCWVLQRRSQVLCSRYVGT